MFIILAEAVPQCDTAFTIDTSLLSILASILVFVSLINNLYKLQIIDEIRTWVVKIEKDFSQKFNSLRLDASKEDGRKFFAENDNILRKSLQWNQWYNLAVCAFWAIIVGLWLFKPNCLKNNIFLGIIYLILFLGSAIVYGMGYCLNKQREKCLSKAEEICTKDDTIFKDAEEKIKATSKENRSSKYKKQNDRKEKEF